jgi:formamidopyrimidine-DNA glycosylase
VPELPEVETVVRKLKPYLPGRRIVSAGFPVPRILRGDPRRMADALAGRTIRGVRRHGKFIVIDLEDLCLSVHLGMTGKLLLNHQPGPYTRALFTLDRGVLTYDDVRQFGRIEVSSAVPERIRALGPDALTIAADEFVARLRARRMMVKPLLLNQRFLGGMGNIYSDEALFRARIHPRAIASRIGKQRALRLYQAMREVLMESIGSGGSSIADYVDAEGRRGEFQNWHRVYQRTGQSCLSCGVAIRRILVGQRSTHFCPRCQRR